MGVPRVHPRELAPVPPSCSATALTVSRPCPPCVAHAAQKPEAKKDDKAKPAKKMPNIPGLDSKLFKMAMAEQKSHGVERHGAHLGRSREDG